MQDGRDGPVSSNTPAQPTTVSSDNPCPFLRAVVSEGFVGGHVVPLATLAGMVQVASGKTGFQKIMAGVKTWMVALIANGLGLCRLVRSAWSGATLDQLRNGPLDKHGVGSRILSATAHVNEEELARFASFGKDRADPSGGTERGLTANEIETFMDANFERAKGHRRRIDRKLMKGEWPVLLDIMGKGEGEHRYLSVAEVRTLFTERRLPARINARLRVRPTYSGVVRTIARVTAGIVALAAVLLVVVAEFPSLIRPIPKIGKLMPPALPARVPVKAAYWLDQNWSTDDRFWFHHASQGTATFPVPYSWYIALEQPGLRLFTRPGMLADSAYLERFGFIPSPKTVRTDAGTLRRFGFVNSDAKTEPAPESVAGLKPLPADNIGGLPVGFARMTGVVNPATGGAEPDKIGLTCAGCHTGSINYKGTSIRFDGGPSMLDLRKLELTTGLSILYTLYVPGRFDRFANRVLGRDAGQAERDKLKEEMSDVWKFLKSQIEAMDALESKGQPDTPEGYGRLDALNRIGNQVFYTDFVKSNLQGYEKNLHANDAPVSYPPVWTVPWLWWAQYDASIEQPLIRNAGEALGVRASLNLSPDFPPDRLFRSSVALENLVRIEAMLRGPDPFVPRKFGGLTSPKWPSHLFPDDPDWKIDQERVARGRTLYGNMCAECHLGPVADTTYDEEFKGIKDKTFWTDNKHWKQDPNGSWILNEVQKKAAVMGTDSAQANVLAKRQVQIPDFLKMDPAKELKDRWKCEGMETYSSTEMPFSIALMITVQRTSEKWLSDRGITDPEQIKKVWGQRTNCPNTASKEPLYRARPLNGVWATAPYIHNGSVPSLYWMLMPQGDRPKQFCLGARDFDPKKVGFDVPPGGESSCKTGQTLFSMMDGDKEIKGNSVLGHSFEAKPETDMKDYQNGVIGRKLSEGEIKDLIEYLKTL